jgi:hypothetical protein
MAIPPKEAISSFIGWLGFIISVQRFRDFLDLIQKPCFLQIKLVFVDLAGLKLTMEFPQGGHRSLLLVLEVLPRGFFHFAANGDQALHGRQQ